MEEYWGTTIKVDEFGNLVSNLPPTKGEIITDEDGNELFKTTVNGTERTYRVSSIYITNNKEGATKLYFQLAKAIVDRASHICNQVFYALSQVTNGYVTG